MKVNLGRRVEQSAHLVLCKVVLVIDLHGIIHTHDLNGTSIGLSQQGINVSAHLLDSTGEAADEADLE